MAKSSVINVLINGDARGLGRALDDAGGKVANFAKSAAAKMAVFASAVGAISGVIGKQAINAASDLNEVTSKTNVIFGDAADEVLKFSKTAASALGQSQVAALEAASTFGVFGKAAGLTGSDLASFSTELATLASDLASFSNTSPEEAAQALSAALRGESEPIRKYGVMLDDAALKAEAFALGIYSGKGSLTQQQKILAAQSAIFKQTSDAQGDFARTSDGVANQQRIVAAQIENVKAKLGQQLLPMFSAVLSFVNTKVIPGVDRLIQVFDKDGLSGVFGLVRDSLPKLRAQLTEWGQALIDWIKPRVGPALQALAGLFTKLANWLMDTGLPWLHKKLQQLGESLIEWIGPRIGPALQALGEFIGKIGSWALNVGLPMLIEKYSRLGEALISWIGPRIGPMLEALTDMLIRVGKWIIDDGLPLLVGTLQKLGQALVKWVGPYVNPALRALGDMFTRLANWLLNVGLPTLWYKLQELGRALVDWIGPRIGPALQALGDLLGRVANWVLDVGLPLLVDKLIVLGQALVDWIKPRIAPMLKELGVLAGELVKWIVTVAVPKLAEQAAKLAGALLSWVAQLIPGALEGLGRLVLELVKRLPGMFVSLIKTMATIGVSLGSSLINALVDALKGLGSRGLDVGKAFANEIIRFINRSVISRINDLLDFTISVPFGPDIRINPPDIPGIPLLAEGGIVTRPTLAVIGEAGPEAVVPLSRNFGGTGTVVFNVTVSNPVASGEQLANELAAYTRRNGTRWLAGVV